MMKSLVAAAIASAIISSTAAEQSPVVFPLQFRALEAQEAMDFPSGYGVSVILRTARPAEIKKEPKATSPRPLYGWLGQTNQGLLLRLDQSSDSGAVYDRLIVDVNQNQDLTDDTPVKAVRVSSRSAALGTSRQQMIFGPIEGPPDKGNSKVRPRYFAEASIYSSTSSRLGLLRTVSSSSGRLRVKPGWLLETTVTLPGVRQKLGFVDADCNLQLGEPWKVLTTKLSSGTENWSIRIGDTVLMDTDTSGKFVNKIYGSKTVSMSSMVYLGNDPYQLTIAPDYKSLQVQPWPEATSLVNLKPRGLDVTSLTLLWQAPDQQWQMIKPGVVNGHVKLPPGNYHLYSSTLSGLASSREQVSVMGYKRTVGSPFCVDSGKQNSLLCGAPMEIKLTMTKPAQTRTTGLFIEGLDRSNVSDTTVRLSATAIGAGGETYTSFAQGAELKDKPPKPTFLVYDNQGRRLASGNLEFG